MISRTLHSRARRLANETGGVLYFPAGYDEYALVAAMRPDGTRFWSLKMHDGDVVVWELRAGGPNSWHEQ